jgi:hypothetical protein
VCHDHSELIHGRRLCWVHAGEIQQEATDRDLAERKAAAEAARVAVEEAQAQLLALPILSAAELPGFLRGELVGVVEGSLPDRVEATHRRLCPVPPIAMARALSEVGVKANRYTNEVHDERKSAKAGYAKYKKVRLRGWLFPEYGSHSDGEGGGSARWSGVLVTTDGTAWSFKNATCIGGRADRDYDFRSLDRLLGRDGDLTPEDLLLIQQRFAARKLG